MPAYRDDLMGTDDPGVFAATGGRSWISGHMAQLMVFLNGLILTVATYVLLGLFIQNWLSADQKNTIEETRGEIAGRMAELEQTVKSISMIVSFSSPPGEEALRARVGYAAPGISRFDRLFWLSRKKGGRWQVTDLTSEKIKYIGQPILAAGAEPDLYEFLGSYASYSKNKNYVIVTADLPGASYIQENESPLIRDQPFVLIKLVEDRANEQSMVVGITRMTRIIDAAWMSSKPSLQGIVVRDLDSNKRIYYMSSRGVDFSEADAYDPSPQETFELAVGSAVWKIGLEAGRNVGTDFLYRLPLLVLFLGIALTMVGTMYVRNNQRQSWRLAAMNRVLAQKNYELNSEISERERLNLVLRKTEREYRATIDAVSDIIFETTTEGVIVFLNQTWKKVTGFDIDQSLNRNLIELLHPQDQEEQRRNFDQMVKGKRHAYRTFTRLRTYGGTFRSVEMAISMLRQDENRNMRIVGTFTDVEERRRAERALSEAEKKYRTIVENAAGGIYQLTPAGLFLSANQAMSRILGYENPERMLREIHNAHEDLYVSQRERSRFIRELEASGIVKNFEAQMVRRDKSKIWINENARVVRDDEGHILYYEGSMEDITKRKEVEIKLREAKVQSDLASRAKSEFLANMSHELRTPLNAIIGFSEIIRDEILGPLGNRQYWEYARDVHDSGKKLLDLINEILEVSRIDAGDRQLNEGIVDMAEVSVSCLDLLHQKAVSGGLTVTNLIQAGVPKVIGEELAIKQILLNLLSNAIKFTPPGGRITLSYESDSDGQLRVSVTDTGIGLDENEIEKALSPFGQVETAMSRSASASGAGLGLTLVDSLIRLHGGKLELFSQKGIGTTATIIFPARRVAQEASASGDKEKSPSQDAGDRPPSYSRLN